MPVEVVSTILLDDSGVAHSVVGTIRDVSAAREQAERQRKFTSMLNHEFRTPCRPSTAPFSASNRPRPRPTRRPASAIARSRRRSTA
ncbi:hypothetical protein LP420_21245 [Massilia sp. B-10]|nr:hypothetical protein LP420_21245 [Massilia sp. B-10]